ncbi:MAG: amidohydrolase [Gemmataceae bacterium]|nr:amidohydrolase [Gemmataceae bacterium]
MSHFVSLALLLSLGQTLPLVQPAGQVLVFRGATIHTGVGEPILNGVLIVQGGKILAVVPAENARIPNGVRVIEIPGKVIIPGLVDTHSHLGLFGRPQVPANSDGNEGTGSVQPSLRALDAISPDDPGIRMALAGGVTTANIMPGSGNVIGGQTVYVKLRGNTVEQMRIHGIDVLGGLKMANGENPKRFNFEKSKAPPATRMKIMALQREQFLKARDYQRQWNAYREKVKADPKAQPPDVDIGLEALVEVLEKKRTVHFHCHRADDIYSALRLSEEFGFEIVFQHATEAYRIADILGGKKAMVSLTLVDSPGGKAETSGLLEEAAAFLDQSGLTVAINTDDPVTESRFFLRTGAIALRGGMTEQKALRALTANPAKMLHLEKRVGALEEGKDADFVILSGPPFSAYSQVLETWIDGVKRFDRGKHAEWCYQAGGFALAQRETRLPAVFPLVKPREIVETPKTAARPPLVDQPDRLCIRAGRIHTSVGPPIENGVILVEKGKIIAVGPAALVKIPLDTPELAAREVTCGLIDTHTSVGLAGALNIAADQDQDEISDPNQADLRVLDGFNPNEPLLEFQRRQGITLLHVVPGPANVLAGQTGVFRAWGSTVDAMKVRFPAGLLVNLGEIPKKTYSSKAPNTRMATAALLRAEFAKGRDHLRKRSEDGKQEPKPKLDPLADAVAGKLPVLFSAHRADDIQTALRLAKEFGLNARLHQATEAYLMTNELAQAKVPVIVHPTMQRVARMETFNTFTGNASALADKGVQISIGSGYEDYVPKSRSVRNEAAMAMVNGLGFDRALKSITIDAARILGVDKEFGSIAAGKAADLVLYDGDPFEHSTHVTHTIIAGRIVFSREDYLKLPFSRRALPMLGFGGDGCCLGW